MAERQASAAHGVGVVRHGADLQTGKQAEYSIQRGYDSAGEKSDKRVAGNGELRDEPFRAGLSMGKNPIEELLQLIRKEAVQEKVRDDQIVLTDGLPLQSFGKVQTDVLRAGLLNTAIQDGEHGLAGVDHIRMKTRVDCQKLVQEASVSIA